MADGAPSYGEAFARSWQEIERREAELTLERKAAPELLRELLAQAPADQGEKVAREARFHTWSLCERLLDISRDRGFHNPVRALELAQLGIRVATCLSPAVYGESRVNDLLARAWVTQGSAQRIQSNCQGAEKSFTRAEGLLKQGTGDPLEKAHLLLHRASFLGGQRRFGEAFRLLDRVTAIARRCEDWPLQGRAMITRGFLLGIAHDPGAAIRYLTEGIGKLDPTYDLGLHREALAALLIFQRAAEMECVTLGLIREVSSFLKKNGVPASLRFRESR